MESSPDQGQRDRDLAATMAALRAMNVAGPHDGDRLDIAVAKLPGKGEWAKAAPGVAMICGTLLILAFVIVFMVLTVTGSPTDSFFRLINLFLNALGAIATLTTLIVALVHARRTLENRRIAQVNAAEAHVAAQASTRAAEAVNGGMEARIARALRPVVEDVVRRAVADAFTNHRCPGGSEKDADR